MDLITKQVLEPTDLKKMIKYVRQTEKILGGNDKKITISEKKLVVGKKIFSCLKGYS